MDGITGKSSYIAEYIKTDRKSRDFLSVFVYFLLDGNSLFFILKTTSWRYKVNILYILCKNVEKYHEKDVK